MFKNTQTKILGITSLLAAASGILFYLFKGEAYKSGSFLLFAGMPLAINLYTVHCVITGKCTMYSWLLTVVLTLYAAGIFLLYAKLILKNKEVNDIVQQKTQEATSLQDTVESSLGF
jgi:hypothetical protein